MAITAPRRYSSGMIPITGKAHDLGDGFFVTRLLPQAARRSIGPFVFFDYFGPVDFPPGKGIDVRPHPHIGLATITYLFDGAQMHRDSLGSVQEIRPGDVNWMTAGRGIVHSERTGAATRAAGHRMHGIQSWIGLPQADEDAEPAFQHFARADLPEQEADGVTLRLIAGEAFGLRSPVRTFSPIFYADARFAPAGRLHYGIEHQERALFVVEGEIQVGGDVHGVEVHGPGAMLALDPGEPVTLYADGPARVMLLGGAALDGPRHIWWNFVASSRERIERAKTAWKSGAFGTVPGDDKDFIPLPE
jgi:redox-sensitive bicupin YhaK (pirin superfamily)